MTDRRQVFRRVEDRATIRSILVIFTLLFIGMGFGLWKLEQNDYRDSHQRGYINCNRINRADERTNDHAYIAWRAYTLAEKRESVLAARDSPATVRRVHQDAATQFRDQAAQLDYVPPYDCDKYVDHPRSYIPPEPIMLNDLYSNNR